MTTTRKPRKASQAQIDAREAKLTELQGKLSAGISELTNSDDWKRMLDTAAKFHQYSFNNLMLILIQCPNASRIASYNKWQELGRQVITGQKAISIFAPLFRKMTADEAKASGDPEAEGMSVLYGFKLVPVFDISQTEGEEIPDIRPVLLKGEAPEGMWAGLVQQAEAAGFTVKTEDPGMPGANGWMNPDSKIICIRPAAAAQMVKTMAHELAHALLGHGHNSDPRSQGEVEAESVAYLVCAEAGMDTSGYSLPYVAIWASRDKDSKVIEETAAKVIKQARAILEALESVPEAVAA